MDISVIIVSWNVKDALRRCLQSLEQHSNGVIYEVIVVDNASSDGTVEEFNVWRSNLAARFDLVKLISNPQNRGFAAACNQGAKEISDFRFSAHGGSASGGQISDFSSKASQSLDENQKSCILFLFPDTQIQSGTLRGVVDFFRTHHKAGVVGGRVLNINGTIQPSVRRFPHILDQVLILLGLHKGCTLARVQPLKRYFSTDFDYSREAQVDQVMGAFFAVRREVFQALHGFDESFFCWFEEVDFCKRVRKAGWEVWYTPTASVTHQGGASFKQRSRLRLRLIWLKSLWKYFKKHGW